MTRMKNELGFDAFIDLRLLMRLSQFLPCLT